MFLLTTETERMGTYCCTYLLDHLSSAYSSHNDVRPAHSACRKKERRNKMTKIMKEKCTKQKRRRKVEKELQTKTGEAHDRIQRENDVNQYYNSIFRCYVQRAFM